MKIKKTIFLVLLAVIIVMLFVGCNSTDKTTNDEFRGFIVATGSEIVSIDRSFNVTTLYNGENINFSIYQNNEIIFLEGKDTNNKLYSINLNKEEVEEITSEGIQGFTYNYTNNLYKFYNENNEIVFEFKEENQKSNRSNYNDVIGVSNNMLENPKSEFEYKDWVYYTDDSDGNKIYRKSKNGQVTEKINDDNSSIFKIINDYILYENTKTGELIKLKIDGSSRIIVASRELFYNDIDNFIKNGKYIGDYDKDIVPYYNLHFINEDYLYFNVIFPDGGSGTFRIFAKTKLDDEKEVQVLGELGASSFITKGDWIYYQKAGTFYNVGINRINLTTGKIEVIHDGGFEGGRYYIIGETIIYISSGKLYKMNLDGSEKTILFQNKDEDDYTWNHWFIY